MFIHINTKFYTKSRYIVTLTLFGLILLSVVPAMFSGFSIYYYYHSPPLYCSNSIGTRRRSISFRNNETLTPAQQQAREQLLNEQGFSVNVIARNLSAPLNLLYGPDDTLWITERVGKDIVTNRSELMVTSLALAYP